MPKTLLIVYITTVFEDLLPPLDKYVTCDIIYQCVCHVSWCRSGHATSQPISSFFDFSAVEHFKTLHNLSVPGIFFSVFLTNCSRMPGQLKMFKFTSSVWFCCVSSQSSIKLHKRYIQPVFVMQFYKICPQLSECKRSLIHENAWKCYQTVTCHCSSWLKD